MKSIPVSTASGNYDVIIGEGILDKIGEAVRQTISPQKAMVVCGENVFPLYGARVLDSLRGAGIDASVCVFPAGEETKCILRYEELLQNAAEHALSRSDCFVALGGGVTGDLTGFAAATYQRGIPYVQIPTTLLAAVDSSVGGKTAVNLKAGKNQVGAFWQPALVFCDAACLQTLPERELRAGYAEVIKYAGLEDAELFANLQQRNSPVTDVVDACVRMKAEIVAEDERDTGKRKLLNLGHSFGHAVEAESAYELLHGEAVAIGMAMICRAAVKMGMLEENAAEEIFRLLKDFGLPVVSPYGAERLWPRLLLDKKFAAGKIELIVPRSVGSCERIPMGLEELRRWLDAACENGGS